MRKFIITAELRDITDLYDREEITYSRMVELLNEKADEWYESKQLNIPDVSNSHCLVVTCLPCNTPFRWKEAPEGCCECGMLEWLCFNTEQEANEAFKKQYPEQFDGDGKYIGTQHR